MKLIAESGSTRTEWALVEDNRLIQRAFTEGLNPFFQTRREISRSVRLGLPEHFFKRKLEQVYYYGAGCTSYEKKNVLGASLVAQFKTPIQVESDLLAAARGLFKCEAGIACILGTGSNSCFYDGKIVVKNVRAGGYILGDEGSGAVLGKMFLSDVLKGLAPKDVTADFFEKFRRRSFFFSLGHQFPFHGFLEDAAPQFFSGHQGSPISFSMSARMVSIFSFRSFLFCW